MRSRHKYHCGAALLVLLFTALPFPSVAEEAAKACPGLNYQTGTCECPKGEKCAGCPCGTCTADAECACAEALKTLAGTISGTVKVSRTRVNTEGPKHDGDVVVYLEKVGANKFPAPAKHAKVDQKGLVFIPHVLAVQKGTTVDFLNTDNDKHNVYFVYDSTGKKTDLGTVPPGITLSRVFDKVDTAIVLCKLHLEMAAYLVVLHNPYFTTVKIDGEKQQASFTIKNVPPGRYTLKAWHKKLKLMGGEMEVAVEGGKTTSVEAVITKDRYAKKKIASK